MTTQSSLLASPESWGSYSSVCLLLPSPAKLPFHLFWSCQLSIHYLPALIYLHPCLLGHLTEREPPSMGSTQEFPIYWVVLVDCNSLLGRRGLVILGNKNMIVIGTEGQNFLSVMGMVIGMWVSLGHHPNFSQISISGSSSTFSTLGPYLKWSWASCHWFSCYLSLCWVCHCSTWLSCMFGKVRACFYVLAWLS